MNLHLNVTAGFSKTAVNYMNEILLKLGIIKNESEYSIDLLNATFKRRLAEYYSTTPVHWTYFDEKLDWDGCFSGSGDEPSQFCLWIRPDSLLDDAYYKKQVVGHTELCIYDKVYLQKGENKIIIVDSPKHEIYDVFDTQKEYTFLSVLEVNKIHKNIFRVINNIKSQLIMHNDKEDFIRKSLKDYFFDDVTEKLIKLAFKEYSE